MTNDAKFGLVVGVGLVVLVAVVFYRQELATQPAAGSAAATVVTTNRSPAIGSPGTPRPATPTSTTRMAERRPGLNHTVKEGETLFSLAQQYYGDGRQYLLIYRANERILSSPEGLASGMVLFIPELPAESPAQQD